MSPMTATPSPATPTPIEAPSAIKARALRRGLVIPALPLALNVTGPETLSVREVARAFGERMRKPVTFTGQEGRTALLNNSKQAFDLYGKPGVTAEQMVDWISEWLLAGGGTLGKPTHFSSRSGDF